MRICGGARGVPLVLALAAAPLGGARAEALKPVDAQDPGFARLTSARAPGLVWQLDLERGEASANKTAQKEPQRKADLVGLVLPGDGRALALFTGTETDGRRVSFLRVADGEGRALRIVGVEAGYTDEYMSPTVLGDRGFLAVDDKGSLLRFDSRGRLVWRIPRDLGRGEQVWITDVRPLERGGLLVTGLISGSEHRPASAGQRHDRVHVSRSFLELSRYE